MGCNRKRGAFTYNEPSSLLCRFLSASWRIGMTEVVKLLGCSHREIHKPSKSTFLILCFDSSGLTDYPSGRWFEEEILVKNPIGLLHINFWITDLSDFWINTDYIKWDAIGSEEPSHITSRLDCCADSSPPAGESEWQKWKVFGKWIQLNGNLPSAKSINPVNPNFGIMFWFQRSDGLPVWPMVRRRNFSKESHRSSPW